jgi:hypothetical protein
MARWTAEEHREAITRVLEHNYGSILNAAMAFELGFLRALHQDSNNPIHAWNAYRRCRQKGIGIPEWVFACFDRSAANIMHLQSAEGAGEKVGSSDIAVALEMKKAGRSGRGTVFSKARSIKWVELALAVIDRLADGDQEYWAIDHVARAKNLSYASVNRAWKRAVKLYPALGFTKPRNS